jgi:uncharacterized secreted protein with C-terminal beta-propeller domain
MGQSVLNRRSVNRRVMRRGTSWASFVALESRQLLAASFGGELWKIVGTNRDDRISVVQDGRDPSLLLLRVNGEAKQRARVGKLTTIWIDGRRGDDRLDVQVPAQYAKQIRVRLDGSAGNDTLVGGATADELRGGTGDDVLLGRGRNDVLDGGAGADDLSGDDGADSLIGSQGHDKLSGGPGMDTLRGSGGDDSLAGGADGDKLFGEKGRDQLDGGAGRDRLDGGSGVDSVRYTKKRDEVRGPVGERREGASASSLERVASGLAQSAVEYNVESNRWYFGKPVAEVGNRGWYSVYRNSFGDSVVLRTASLAFDSRSVVSGTSASVVSETNVQEVGVDEADTVETDGQHIYSLDGDELIVTDVRDPRDLKIVSRTALAGSVSGIYLLPGGKLTVVSQTGGFAVWGWRSARLAITDEVAADQQSTGPQVTITTYDVSEAAAPSVTNVTTLDGSLQSSRVVDGRMYVVLRNQLETVPVEAVGSGADARYETEGEFRTRIASLGDAVLPGFTSVTGDRTISGEMMSDATTFAGAQANTDGSYATVVGIDLAAPENGPFASTSVETRWVTTTYASKDSIYLAGTNWDGAAGTHRTSIAKFSLAGGAITLDATGTVAGRAESSFNFDESGDTLRVSTTYTANGTSENAVTILRDVGDTLEQIGQVDGLAPTERIFATRYIDDRCYLVTFRQTDPLFVIDLSDPTKPTVEGELKVPGRSTYLHPLADDLLFGVGQEFDETGFRTGQLKLQLFDVRDASNPRELDVQYVGEEQSYSMSNAENDHHAFQFFADAGVIALPTTQRGETVMSLFKVDREAGIEAVGDFGAAPGWWWTDMKPVRINGTVFAVDANHVASATLDEGKSLDAVTINEESESSNTPDVGLVIRD